jgi:hypothetical protein
VLGGLALAVRLDPLGRPSADKSRFSALDERPAALGLAVAAAQLLTQLAGRPGGAFLLGVRRGGEPLRRGDNCLHAGAATRVAGGRAALTVIVVWSGGDVRQCRLVVGLAAG